MHSLTNMELEQINGGISMSLIKAVGVGLAALGTFVASVIYGYIHPNKCE